MAEARPIISDVIQSRAGGGPLVVFVHPIVLSGRVQWVLGASLHLAERDVLSDVVGDIGSEMNAAPVGIAFTRHRRFELVSREFCRIFGWSENEAGGREANMIYASNEDYAALGPLVRDAFQKSGDYVGEWRMLRNDGTAFWGQLRGRPVDPADPNHGTIWSIVDVTQQVTDRESLEWSATHDPLTGLGNRKYFHARAQRLLDTRSEAAPAALIAIDLDHFKPVNDTAGHAAGDAMLRAVAAVIAASIRGQDFVARLGGDEFAILLDHCSDATAGKIAEKIGAAIRAHVLTWEGHSFSVGASLGIATLRPDIRTPEAWLELADAACYSAKQAGRGRVMSPTIDYGLPQ